MRKIVILGAGTGGTVMANLLHKRLDKKDWSITAIAKEEGIAELTPAHWKVIEFMQKDFKENALSRPSGSSTKWASSAPRNSTRSFPAVRPRRRPRSPE
jgi:hypothetical protein